MPAITSSCDRTPTHRAALLLAVLIALPTASNIACATDWPQFLGPDRNGISAETGLIDTWPANGPKELWRVNGGVGMSGMTIVKDSLVTMIQRDEMQFVAALNASTGKTLWQTVVAPEYRNNMGAGPRATPTISDGVVYAFTGEGILAALDLNDGKILWKRNLLQELSGRPAEYGMACSPLISNGQVIVTIGAPGATVVACDAKSGKTLWTAGDDPTGYSSPAILNVGGQSQIVVFTGSSALGLELGSGKFLWSHAYETAYDCNIATPIAVDGKVFISSGEDHGSALLKLTAKGDAFTASEVWASNGSSSAMRNEWQTSILHNGHLYGMDNVGGAGPITHLACIEAATGKRVWQEARFGKGNLIFADGKLFISTMRGELVIARATPERYEEISRAKVFKGSRTAPALANGRLYLRDDKEIVCFHVER